MQMPSSRWPRHARCHTNLSCFSSLLPGVLLVGATGCLAAEQAPAGKWSPYLDLEGKWGTERSIGEGNFFLPLLQSERTLYFANLRGRIDDSSDNEGSIGGGVRHMLDSGWNLGAYGFWDHRRTEFDNTFNQATFGVEALGPNLEWRANLYQPIGTRSHTFDESSRGEVVGSGLMVATTYQQEQALPGFDLEAGWRLPLFDAEDERQLRVFLAGYRFEDDGIKVEGTRVRSEYSMTPFRGWLQGAQLTLSAEYQDDNARDDQGFLGLRLRIPLGGGASRASSLNAQERRMLAPIVRDVDIVSQVRAHTERELATATATGQQLVALSSADLAGSALSGAVTEAGANSTVVLSGDFTNVGQLQLQAGQSLIGRGNLEVRTASGRAATVSLPGASISGSLVGNSGLVRMADNSTLTGLNITHINTDSFLNNPIGVEVKNVSNASVIGNTVFSASEGGTAFGIRLENAFNITVANNHVTALHPTANAVALQLVSASAKAYGNTLYASGSSGSYAVFLVDTYGIAPEFLPGSVDNVNQGGTCLLNGAPGSPIGTLYFTDGTVCP